MLIDIPSQKPLCEWPIQFLRRYGRGRTKFSFEANDKCKHGKGVYTFNTLEGDAIFHLVDMHARGISLRNQMLRKRTSMPDGFKPIGGAVAKKLHHSEGQLIDRLSDAVAQGNCRFGDSANDILVLNPSDSVSQSGTLRNDLKKIEEGTYKPVLTDSDILVQHRGMSSIGSGISLEIAQNMSQVGDELKETKVVEHNTISKLEPANRTSLPESSAFDSSFEEDSRVCNKLDVSVIPEETLAETLQSNTTPERTDSIEKQENISNSKKVKRNSSLKLPSALKRSNSSKDSSIKKSQSVKRSNSFRNRFFKSKSSEEEKSYKADKKDISKIEQDKLVEELKNFTSPTIPDIDAKIAQQKKVKEILAKAIEDDMNRNSESELSNGSSSKKEDKQKKRRFPIRHKSNEMLGNGVPDKNKSGRLSSSFAGYDYKGHAVLSKTNSAEKEIEGVLLFFCIYLFIY